MKVLVLFCFLIYLINCQISLEEEEKLEYFINYTLIPPIGGRVKKYIMEPNFEVGTLDFIIYFSNRALSCTFDFYAGDIHFDRINIHYTPSLTYTLKKPDLNISIIKMEVTNLNHEDPYYLYMYNKNYIIPLTIPNYYLYQISVKDLEINYKINKLGEDINLKMEAEIQYPLYKDSLNIILNDEGTEYSHSFNETSSFEFELKKSKNYFLKLIPKFNSEFTNKTLFFISFEKTQSFPVLYYKNNILTYTTILTNNKWYIIDSINLINNYNYYKFSIVEGYQGMNTKNLNIRIKKYDTSDINYIKNNIPISIEGYDENHILKADNTLVFKTCENPYPKEKAILIYIELNYESEKSLYKYSFEKILEYKNLEFKSYDINWYTYYEFDPVNVQSNDFIFISTNHSNTVFPINSGNFRKFDTFYNGYLFISFPDNDINKNQVNIIYSDESVKEKSDEDIGHMEIFKINKEEMSFEVIKIEDYFETRIFSFELKKNNNKYFYIKINNKYNYYIFYEGEDNNSFLTIEKMPINIRQFNESKTKTDIKLMLFNNEYFFKIGYLMPLYSLMNVYIIKNENFMTIDLEEGKMKMITYPRNENKIKLQININEIKVNNETFINLRIPLKTFTDNFNIISLDTRKNYILNNTGINIYNIHENFKFNLEIYNFNNISETIPIIIKLGIEPYKIKIISLNNRYEFNYGDLGVIKYKEDKILNLKFETNLKLLNYYYYNGYLSEDFINDTSNIISPELFNNIYISSKEYYFKISTELELERRRNKLNINNKDNIIINEYLFLIFSFDGKVEISIEEKDSEKNRNGNKLFYILIPIFIFMIIVIVIIGIFIYKKKIKTKKEITPEKTPIKEENYEEDTEFIKPVTEGQDLENKDDLQEKLTKNEIEIENMKISNINNDNSYDPSQPAPLAFEPNK